MSYNGTNVRWENRRVHTDHVVFGEVLYKPKGSCGPRTQRDFELVRLHSGECSVTVNKLPHELTIGKAYLFLPGGREHFHFSTQRETHQSWCSIGPAFMPRQIQKALEGAPFVTNCSDLFNSLLSAAFSLHGQTQGNFTLEIIEQLGICLFMEFLHTALEGEANSTLADPPVRSFLRYIEDHFADEECLEAARLATGVSSNALLYKFKAAMQCTPATYLWNYRIHRGIAMLTETGQTVSEIAYQCGFKNPFHFSRKVKEQTGKSPKQIRARAFQP